MPVDGIYDGKRHGAAAFYVVNAAEVGCFNIPDTQARSWPIERIAVAAVAAPDWFVNVLHRSEWPRQTFG